MIRIIVENVLLFLLPTAMYLAYMLLTRRTASGGNSVVSDAPLLWLFVTGALLVAATLIYYGATATGGRPDQTYTPPRMKDGRIEPGQIK